MKSFYSGIYPVMRKNIIFAILLLLSAFPLTAQPPKPIVNLGFLHFRNTSNLDYEITVLIASDSMLFPGPPPTAIPCILDDPTVPGAEMFFSPPIVQVLPRPNAIRHFVYRDTITLPYGGVEWNMTHKSCCRPDSIDNMNPGFDNSFAFSSTLYLNNCSGNTTAMFDQPPVTFARLDTSFYFNPGYYDRDSTRDSLSFHVFAIKDTAGPGGMPNSDWNPLPGNFAVDSMTGEMRWNAPDTGSYAFRVVADEFDASGTIVASVDYDYFFFVRDVPANPVCNWLNTQTFPVLNGKFTFTTSPGQTLNVLITAQDPGGDPLSLSGGGENLSITTSLATFSPVNLNDSTSEGNYSWTPDSANIRSKPYMVVFRVDEETGWNNFTAFSDLTIWIYVDSTIISKENLIVDAGAKIYPNPASNLIAIEFNTEHTGAIGLEIRDLTGKIISGRLHHLANPGKVILFENVSALSDGVYFFEIKDPNGDRMSLKWMKSTGGQ